MIKKQKKPKKPFNVRRLRQWSDAYAQETLRTIDFFQDDRIEVTTPLIYQQLVQAWVTGFMSGLMIGLK